MTMDNGGVGLTEIDVPGPHRDLIGYRSNIPQVYWPGGARVAINIVLNYEEGSEYSYPLGDGRNESLAESGRGMPSEYRDLRVESVYEYGSRAGVWRLMRLFDRYGIKVTFFATALALERNPDVCRGAKESGHEIAAHGWRWTEPWLLDRREEQRQIQLAIESIERTCGERPRGWYSRYGPSVNTRELVVEAGGFRYDADAYNDDLPYFVNVHGAQHLVVPYTLIYNDIRYVLPEGFASPQDFFETCKAGFNYLWEEGADNPRMMSIGLHPRWAGHPPRTAALRDFIEYALGKGDVWFARRLDIAEHWWTFHGASEQPRSAQNEKQTVDGEG